MTERTQLQDTVHRAEEHVKTITRDIIRAQSSEDLLDWLNMFTQAAIAAELAAAALHSHESLVASLEKTDPMS